jgi:hypothetical protein
MKPEQRLDRAERILLLMAKAGRRARKEWTDKVNILINAQIETEEAMKGLASSQARLDREMAELAKSHRLTEQAVRDFINSSRKGRNGKSTS